MTEIQYRVTYEDHRLFVLAQECSRQGTIASFYQYAVADPLPELCLGGPELLSSAADYKRRLLLFCLLCAHSQLSLVNQMRNCLAVH